jgi:hypothetical protein
MILLRVKDRKTGKMFLDTARIINKNDEVWVCPLDMDINAVFDPLKNTFFKHGEAERWVLTDDDDNLVGRIAAFIDYKLSDSYDQPTGGIGFFECINDKNASVLLFDTAREWLKDRGMEAMDGPINFGETDKYWGLLVEGFTHPSFDVPYNQPYYQSLFEDYGFQVYYKMTGYHLDLTKPMSERFTKIAEWVSKKPGYKFRHFTWEEQEKFSRDFVDVYNEAWPSFKIHFEPLEADYLKNALKKAKHIIDEEFIWFAYFEDKPVAIYLMVPDVNQIIKYFNGKMNLLNLARFFYLRKRKTMTRIKGLMMGMVPKFQHLGIESVFILKLLEVLRKKPHYTEVEFSWVADFNPKMRKIFLSVGGVPAKQYVTYRYLFDRDKEFKRYPIPDIKN